MTLADGTVGLGQCGTPWKDTNEAVWVEALLHDAIAQPAIGTDASRLAEVEESLWEEVSVSQHCVWQSLSDIAPCSQNHRKNIIFVAPVQQYYKNSGEVYYRALSGFDTAVWDALAKRQKMSVCNYIRRSHFNSSEPSPTSFPVCAFQGRWTT